MSYINSLPISTPDEKWEWERSASLLEILVAVGSNAYSRIH